MERLWPQNISSAIERKPQNLGFFMLRIEQALYLRLFLQVIYGDLFRDSIPWEIIIMNFTTIW